MGTRTWVQILLIFVAYKHTAIPPWSYVAVSTNSAPAFAITEWSWLPDGVMPSTNFCVSSWMRVSSVLTSVQFIRIVSGTQSLSFVWASNARVISNSSDLITISTGITYNVWFFVVINVYSSVVYMLIAMKDGQSFLAQHADGSFTLDTSSSVKGPGNPQMTGLFTDATIRFDEDLTDLSPLPGKTFMCGQDASTCLECHPSCASCTTTPGFCDSCADVTNASLTTDGVACLCTKVARKGSEGNYHSQCGDCDSTCGSCWLATDSTQCETCPGETGTNNLETGSCTCPNGAAKATLAEVCPTCFAGCVDCYGPTASECLTQEQFDFITKLGSISSLPLTSARTDQLMCFRQPPSTTTCTPDPVVTMIGTITGGVPDEDQCKKLLVSMWPFLTHWFGQLFNFVDPDTSSADQVLTIKSVMYVWILHFGPAEMLADEWSDLKTALNAGGNWSTHLAWAGETPQFSLNGGSSPVDFPAALKAWIMDSEGCNKSPDGCMDLLPFNTLSTVCDTAACGHKTECDLAFTTHSCTS